MKTLKKSFQTLNFGGYIGNHIEKEQEQEFLNPNLEYSKEPEQLGKKRSTEEPLYPIGINPDSICENCD